jgi:phage N-6-adenine-methyltransferase
MDHFGKISSIASLPLPDGEHIRDFDAAQAAAKKAARAAKKAEEATGVLPTSAITAPDSPAAGIGTPEKTKAKQAAAGVITFPSQLMFSATESNKDGSEWATPQDFFDILDAEFHFTLDAAASDLNHKCAAYYTKEQDALQQKWTGTVWCNPPFTRKHIGKWLTKGIESASAGATVVFVLPVRTDTRWFRNLVEHKAEVRFVPGRVKFEHATGKKNAAPFPSMVVIYRPPNWLSATAPSAETIRKTENTESPHLSPSALIEETEKYLRRYVSFVDSSNAFALALWTVGTHIYEAFDAYGYLAIIAATKRAGKTRLMEILSFLAARSHHSADITPAALFALVENEKPTLMVDEAERFAASQKDFRAIINSGYRRGGTVTRRQGTGVRHYKVYCPKVFVLIGDLYDTLRDRSIIISLRRAHAPERFIYVEARSEGNALRDEVATLLSSRAQEIADAYSGLDRFDFLADREEEIWSPLFAVCRVVCPDRWQELERVAVDIATTKTAEARKHTDIPQHEDAAQQIEYGERALRDLIQIVRSQRRKAISTAAAIPALRDLPTGPWRAFRGEGLKTNIEGSMLLASLLEPFGVRPHTIRLRPKSEGANGSTAKGYVLADLVEAAEKTGVFL